MGKPSAPEPPDPYETASAQTSTNLATAQANSILGNVNQITPQGSLTYQQSGQQFVSDPNGQTWYRGPNGELTQTAPQGYVPPSSTSGSSSPFGDVTREDGGFEGATVQTGNGGAGGSAGSGFLPDGWEQITGHYVPQWTATQEYSPGEQAVYDANLTARQNLANLAANQSGFLDEYLGKPMDLSGMPGVDSWQQVGLPGFQQFANAPQLATSFGDAGAINQNFATSFGDAGQIGRDIDNAGEITRSYNGDFSEDRQRVEDALMARMQPQLDRQREALETRLANQGIRLGSDAYSFGQADFGRQVNDAVLGNILAAGQEQSRLVGMERDRAVFENAAQAQQYGQNANDAAFANAAQQQAYNQLLGRAQFGHQGQMLGNQAQQQNYDQLLGRATFGNAATQQNFANQFQVTGANNALQQQQFGNQMTEQQARIAAQQNAQNAYLQQQFALRNQPINEIGALLGTGQVQNPSFVNANMPTIPTVDMAGLINENYNQQLGAWQQQNAASQSLFGGLFGLGSAFIMRSDRRVKDDIEKVGKTSDGQSVYRFTYKDDPEHRKHVGLMAQEVEKKHPEAVRTFGGVKHVDYARALPMGSILRAN